VAPTERAVAHHVHESGPTQRDGTLDLGAQILPASARGLAHIRDVMRGCDRRQVLVLLELADRIGAPTGLVVVSAP